MRVFFSAGEASGDLYAFELASRLLRLDPETTVDGIGGKRFRSVARTLVADSSLWGAISISESFRVGIRVLRGLLAAKRALRQGTPGVFVPIDFGFVNLRLAQHAKSRGWKVLYFIPPGSWRKDRQGADVPKVSDIVVTPFEWSARMLKEMGADARWYGHPLRQLAAGSAQPESARDGVAALPGSRTNEIEQLMPVFAETVRAHPPLPPVKFGVAPNLSAPSLAKTWEKLAPGRTDAFLQEDALRVLGSSRAAIVCSGTATLQAALARCPHVIVYRVSKLVALEAKLIGFKATRVGLPNILLDRDAVPELLQEAATAARIRGELDELLLDGPARTAQLAAFAELEGMLGPDDCLDRTCDAIRELGVG